MNRIKCILQYDGSNFSGYQKQIEQRTVQGEIEQALETMHKEPIPIHSSGRTDAGVHAIGQVFHFDSSLTIAPSNWKRALNSLLPKDLYIKSVEIVDSTFHSRFNVKIKEYRYYVSLDEYDPMKRNYIYFHQGTLDIERMKQALSDLVGTHDFTSFTSGNEVEDRVRTLFDTQLVEEGKKLEFIFRGNGFLRYQIRIMMGTILEIGQGKRELSSIQELFCQNNRSKAGFTADPQGLYLYQVTY